MPKYRVVKITTNSFAPEKDQITSDIVWEGEDIHALSNQHPPSRIFGADDLGYASIEDGWIKWHHEFEKFVNGSWVACHDPRVRLNPESTPLEDAIEEENRRLFPGDYPARYPSGDDDYYDPWDYDPEA